jgi:hypothetical protein
MSDTAPATTADARREAEVDLVFVRDAIRKLRLAWQALAAIGCDVSPYIRSALRGAQQHEIKLQQVARS